MNALTAARRMYDGLANVLSGAGGVNDKRSYDIFTFTPLSQQQIEAAYRGSWVARKVVDLPPFDMTREWRDWQAKADQIELLEAEERRLGIRAKVREALTWARLYGGGALLLGGLPGDATMPASPGAVGRGGLAYVHAVTRHQLTIPEIELDPGSPFFGQPTHYELNGSRGPVRIHPSRVIPFVGQAIPTGTMGVSSQDNFWGDPLIQVIRDAIQNADLSQNNVASLVHEAKVDTIKLPNLMQQLATAEYEARLTKRLTLAESAKSILNTRILDAEEEWDTRQLSFNGLPEIIDKFLQIVAAATDIPVTRMLGTSAKGLNATGKGDNDNYDEMIASRQELELRAQLERLDEVLIRSALGVRPAEIHFTWAPLQKPDPTEEAARQDKRVDTAKKAVDAGLVPLPVMARAYQNGLIEDGVWPGFEGAQDEFKATVGLPVEMFKVLVTAWQAGGSPIDVLYDRMSMAGLLPAGMGLDQFKAAIEEEGPPLGSLQGSGVVPLAPSSTSQASTTDAEPRTLYVSRKVENAAEIIAWAKAQGFETTQPADELHVTVAFSRTPIDWMKVGETWGGDKEGRLTVPAGGARLVEKLGPKGAVVLLFGSWELAYRHGQIREAGASWDWPEYTPHVTITYAAGDLDLAKVEPYRGQIVLGPEIFEEVVDDWEQSVVET